MQTDTQPTPVPADLAEPVIPAVLYTDANYTFATCSDVFVVIWHNETPVPAAAKLRREFGAFANAHGGKVALLTIIEPNAPMPSSEARQALAAFMTDAGDQLEASAVIFEGTGFRAAAVRSVVIGLTMLARQPYPHKAFATLTEGLHWMVAARKIAHGAVAYAASLIDGVKTIRAQVEPKAATN